MASKQPPATIPVLPAPVVSAPGAEALPPPTQNAIPYISLDTKPIHNAHLLTLIVVAVAFTVQLIVMFTSPDRRISWPIQIGLMSIITVAYQIRKQTYLENDVTYIRIPAAAFEPRNMPYFKMDLPAGSGRNLRVSFS